MMQAIQFTQVLILLLLLTEIVGIVLMSRADIRKIEVDRRAAIKEIEDRIKELSDKIDTKR